MLNFDHTLVLAVQKVSQQAAKIVTVNELSILIYTFQGKEIN